MRWLPVFFFSFFFFFSSKSEKGGFLDRAYLPTVSASLWCWWASGWYALLAGGQLQSRLDSMMFEGLVWACRNDVSIYLKPVICIVFLLWRNGSGSSVKRSADEVEVTALFE